MALPSKSRGPRHKQGHAPLLGSLRRFARVQTPQGVFSLLPHQVRTYGSGPDRCSANLCQRLGLEPARWPVNIASCLAQAGGGALSSVV
ncbi:hypothetical protein Dgeo_2475 (plasmid) [Deinococcus geothermalis DSM 11300]|uniref:Uncharacterized protein n=1 Tax=Deinococcus geothermalis (strain DSM 11300 / CIP 105573 / AG-3a) TaxID=319795 RepID=Q1J3M5_DEIGD|nr:hypothetical protein Dgeo_2475 [Deinococcus geothermalis DSM 11300]